MNRLVSALILLACLVSSLFAQGSLNDIKWSTYKSGVTSKITTERTTVINGISDWQKYWGDQTGNPGDAPGDVDFIQDRLVAINLGSRRSSGSSVYVKSVTRFQSSKLKVVYVERVPSNQTSGSGNSPYVIIRIPRVAGAYVFEKETQNAMVGVGSSGGSQGVGFRTLICGLESPISDQTETVIQGPDDLARYWPKATGEREIPDDIDWSSEMLIGIHLGRRNSTGFDVLVDGIDALDNGFLVRYTEKAPSQGQHVKSRSTSPYVIIRVPRLAGDISFRRHVWNSNG